MRMEYWKSCGASEWNASTASTVRGFLSKLIESGFGLSLSQYH